MTASASKTGFAPTPIGVLLRQHDITSEQIQQGGATPALRSYRVSRHSACPICGGEDECLVIPQHAPGIISGPITHEHVWCVRAGDDNGGTPTEKGSYRPSWYFLRECASGETVRPRPSRPQRQRDPVDPAYVRMALTLAAELWPLSDEHKAKLSLRGYPPEECGPGKTFAFSSLPAAENERFAMVWALIVRLLQRQLDIHALARIPGFHLDLRQRYMGLTGFLTGRYGNGSPIEVGSEGSAIIEWVRNENQEVTGFQYAPDHPPLKNNKKPQKRLNPVGQQSGRMYHVAYPALETGDQDIWYTEGVHKANLVSYRLNVIALASLGAGGALAMLGPLEMLDALKRRLHIVALDADKWGKREEVSLARELTAQGIQVVLARWDAKLGNGPDDALAVGAGFTFQPFKDTGQSTGYRSVLHIHPWQHVTETPEERSARLRAKGAEIARRVRAHFDARENDKIQAIISPPGIGKTHTVAELGAPNTAYPHGEYPMAYMSDRHDLATSVPALKQFRHIEAPHAGNCRVWELHHALAPLGYNVSELHRQEELIYGKCRYKEQFDGVEPTIFMPEHLTSAYPGKYPYIVIDELTPARWLTERLYTVATLHQDISRFPTGSPPDLLYRALQSVLTDAAQEYEEAKSKNPHARLPPGGKAIYDALDRSARLCQTTLEDLLNAIGRNKQLTKKRPVTGIDITDPDALLHAQNLKPLVLPYLFEGLESERLLWMRGQEWNSRLRLTLDPQTGKMALGITEPLKITVEKGKPYPTICLLDATADPELLERFFGKKVEAVVETIDLPPHTRHLATRTGKRWGKGSTKHPWMLERMIAECRWVLKQVDPDGIQSVALITYKTIEKTLAEELGIKYGVDTGHFWGIRGSNQMKEYTILLIVGTPTPPPEEVERIARALYRDDPSLINPTGELAEDGTLVFQDARMQRVANWIINGELAQCAARNRAIQEDGKTIITLCASQGIPFLPITEEIISIPQLKQDGTTRKEANRKEAQARIERAARELLSEGLPLTVRAIAARAKVHPRVAGEWLRLYRARAQARAGETDEGKARAR